MGDVFKRLTLAEFRKTLNGSKTVRVDRMIVNLAGVPVDVKSERYIQLVNGVLSYRTARGTVAYISTGDVLYLKNGEVVEII